MKTLCNNIKPILALLIVVLGFGYFYAVTFMQVDSDSDVKMAIFGLMTASVGYYFGASTGSAKKDETISELSKKQ